MMPSSQPLTSLELLDPTLTVSVLVYTLLPGRPELERRLTVLLIVTLSPAEIIFSSLHFPFSFSVPSFVVLSTHKH